MLGLSVKRMSLILNVTYKIFSQKATADMKITGGDVDVLPRVNSGLLCCSSAWAGTRASLGRSAHSEK